MKRLGGRRPWRLSPWEKICTTVPVNHGFDFSAIYILYGLGKWVKKVLLSWAVTNLSYIIKESLLGYV
jgi:hypothetical protein